MKHWILIALLLIAGCSSDSPEDRIIAMVDAMARAAEDEKMSPLRGAIADDYRDLRDNDRQAVLNIMRGVMREQAGAAAEIYTLEELELLIELYSSPTGRSLLQKNAEFVRGYQPLVVAKLRDRMGVLNGRILEIVGNE